jgi:hypothetical protein
MTNPELVKISAKHVAQNVVHQMGNNAPTGAQ